jgi:SAM-dependent methyltransferase
VAHPAQRAFFERIRAEFPEHFYGIQAIDFGSLDLNGSLRDLFSDCRYTGVDIHAGRNVDVISWAHEYQSDPVDTIVSGEMLEHDPHWMQSLRHMYELLKGGGLLVVSAAGPKRAEHGTTRTPETIPTWDQRTYGEDPNYYRNITKEMLFEFLATLPSHPMKCGVTYGLDGADCYFWMVKAP